MKMFKNIKRILPIPLRCTIKTCLIFISNIIFMKMFNGSSKKGPLFVTWLVTYDCNVFCKFCSTHSLKKRFPDEVSLKRAQEIAHEIGKAQTLTVGFTGGEVFLWPHLFDIIKILKKYRKVVYIVTNGFLLKEKADEIIKNKVDYVIVSIDSDNSKEHDEVRSFPGLYERLTEGIEYLRIRRKSKRPLIKSTTVIYRNNLPKIGRIINNLRSIVDVVSVQPIVGGQANGPHGKNDLALESLMFHQNERKQVEGMFNKLSCNNSDFNNDFFKLIPRYWFCKEDLIKKIHCWSPFLRLQILPNGDAFHCTANTNHPAIGNINKSSILEIWNSPEVIRQREEIRVHKNNCICWTQDASFNVLLNRVPCINKIPNLRLK